MNKFFGIVDSGETLKGLIEYHNINDSSSSDFFFIFASVKKIFHEIPVIINESSLFRHESISANLIYTS